MMPYLALNGWTVPVLRGANQSELKIGDEGRSFDGELLRDLRKLRSRWRMTTPTLTQAEAEAVAGMLYGRGDAWRYDADLYSHKGLAPGGATIGSIRPGVAALGGNLCVDATGVRESKFGAGSLIVESAVTNRLTADSRSCEAAPAGFTAIGAVPAVLSGDSSRAVHGARSLQVEATTGDDDDGARTAGVALGAGTYTVSCYVRSNLVPGAPQVAVQYFGSIDGQTFVMVSPVFTTSHWVRCVGTFTIAAAQTVAIDIHNNSGEPHTFWIDSLQLEAGSTATTWADPTRAAGALWYPPSTWAQATGLTFACWTRPQVAAPALLGRLFGFRLDSPLEAILLQRDAASSNLKLQLIRGGLSYTLTIAAPGIYTGNWHHVVATVDLASLRCTVYVDGLSVGSGVSTVRPRLSVFPQLRIGCDVAANRWVGLMDDVIMLPYAAPASLVAAIAARTTAWPTMPRLRATGDFARYTSAATGDDEGVVVAGKVTGRDIRPTTIAGTHNNNAARVAFEIED